MSSLDLKLQQAKDILDEAIRLHSPRAIFCLFSGGHDSLTSTHFSLSYLDKACNGVVHINTGIGIPDTRDFVSEVCKAYSWNLLEYKAEEHVKADGTPDPQIYEELVLKFGFPGPAGHRLMYTRLKERQLERLLRDYKQKYRDKIMLITGCRKAESSRRMGNVAPIKKQAGKLWVAPLAEFTTEDQVEYMEIHNLPKNPVKQLLCMSGECLCGAFAKPGELEEIRLWYPEVADRIDKIQEKVMDKGTHPWGWNDRPPKGGYKGGGPEELCTSCHAKYEKSIFSPPDPIITISR